MLRTLVLLFCAAAVMRAGSFAGPAVCASCHPRQAESQMQSRHARALRPLAGDVITRWKDARTRDGLYYQYAPRTEGLQVKVTAAGEQFSGILQWIFGAGAQGMTLVGRTDNQYFEHRLSWYATPQRLALTFGHPVRISGDPLGVPQTNETIYRCFNCHATAVERGSREPDLRVMIPGVTCERCHGPGAAHIAAARSARPTVEIRAAIFNQRQLPARSRVELCGSCHRLPQGRQDSPAPEIEDPITVRFQPVGLMASRCFQSSKALSCGNCHDPHGDAVSRDDASYTAACLSCHSVQHRSKCPRPRNQACVSCHMQRTSPAAHLRFTDHRIRIY
ncbi:MAG TPA: multiheme c-type cytochrome [Bryobacteraceae bacterium]|nr:multiheme c-type cytochrome [Bryobacteraceae bacterium]